MPKDPTEILAIIRRHTLELLPDLRPEDITTDKSLADLGANSVDRVEILMFSQEELGVRIPAAEMQGVRNLQALVEVLHRHANASS